MFHWIKNRLNEHYRKCFEVMKKKYTSNTHLDKCYGMYGGDWYTDNLSYECLDCPYLELIERCKDD